MREKELKALNKVVDYSKTTKLQRENAKNARLAEGPEDEAVMRLSRKVGAVQT
jgi:hypothetical protein